jgi:hypothetical protein
MENPRDPGTMIDSRSEIAILMVGQFIDYIYGSHSYVEVTVDNQNDATNDHQSNT